MPAPNQHLTDSEALLRAVDCLLGTVNAERHWGNEFYPVWDPVITAVTCELLLSCGLSPDTPWHVKQLKYARHTLSESFHWLDSKIGIDGAFGTDFWDAARLGILIESCHLHDYFPSYGRLKAYLLDCIRKNTLLAGEPMWTGPGFLAAAADYLDLLGLAVEANAVIQRISACQRADGAWQGDVDPDGHPLVSPVWHTAQVVWTLSRRGPAEHRASINKAIGWIKSVQAPNGSWVGPQQFIIYFTSYALTALLSAEKRENDAIANGIDYLKSQMTSDGKCSDMAGTYLCAFALRKVVGQHFEHNLTVTDYVLSRNNAIRAEAAETVLSTKETELTETQGKLVTAESNYRRLAEKYADAEFVISKKSLIFYSIIIPLVFASFTAVIQFGIMELDKSMNRYGHGVTQEITKTNVVTITNVVAPSVQATTNKVP